MLRCLNVLAQFLEDKTMEHNTNKFNNTPSKLNAPVAETGFDKTLVFLTIAAALVPVSYIIVKRYGLVDKAMPYVEPVMEKAQETAVSAFEAMKADPVVADAVEKVKEVVKEAGSEKVDSFKKTAAEVANNALDTADKKTNLS